PSPPCCGTKSSLRYPTSGPAPAASAVVSFSLRCAHGSTWTLTSTSRYWALKLETIDRKSTRLNSSHVKISYAVFCLKKKKQGEEDSAEGVGQSVMGAGGR